MRALSAGLVSAGGVGHSFIVRMPRLLRTIGPVKATSFRVARRITNSLRTGHPVEDYAALNAAGLIWIALPEAALDRVLRELCSGASLDEKMVVLCGATRDSLHSGPLTQSAARIATLDAIGEERTLIAEGHSAVVRELRRLAAAEGRKFIAIRPASKPLYLAGVHLASHLLLPYFGAAVEILRDAGFSRPEATQVAEGLGARALRAYAKAGRKAWSGAIEFDLRQSLSRDLAAIHVAGTRCAALYENGIRQAFDYFKD
jgi:hypothetical protein